jgi:hypothetical protein
MVFVTKWRARDVADLTVRRPWGRRAAAASALILGGYVVAHQFGAPVWWPSFGDGRPKNVVAPNPAAKAAAERVRTDRGVFSKSPEDRVNELAALPADRRGPGQAHRIALALQRRFLGLEAG